MVIHALAQVARLGILARNDVSQGPSNVDAINPEIRIFARGEKDHQPHADGSRAFLHRVGPSAIFALSGREVREAPVVHLADVTGDDLAHTTARRLRHRPVARRSDGDRDGRNRCDDSQPDPSTGLASRGATCCKNIFKIFPAAQSIFDHAHQFRDSLFFSGPPKRARQPVFGRFLAVVQD